MPSSFPSKQFQTALLKWYRHHQRDLPWRAKDPLKANPYHVWLSEIMFQQTVVATVIPYFEKFIKKWKTIHALAAAKDDEILTAWAGLGYYARARNLILCARQIVDDYDGTFPSTEPELLKLKGIGSYTAAAIRSIAYNQPAIVVDGNVERIAARVFKVDLPLPTAKKNLKERSAYFFEKNVAPAEMAQALMDLGATICIPKTPRCALCPVAKFCAVAGKDEAGLYPLKVQKMERPTRTGQAVIFYTKDNYIFLEKRDDNRMLGGMMGLPTSDWDKAGILVKYPIKSEELIGTVRHIFSHFTLELEVKAVLVTRTSMEKFKNNGRFVRLKDSAESGLPSLFMKAIKLWTKS